MSLKTLEVEIDHGRVIPRDEDTLPEHGRALLNLLDKAAEDVTPVRTSAELLDRWDSLAWLPEEEGNAFADDIESARSNLPPVNSKWD